MLEVKIAALSKIRYVLTIIGRTTMLVVVFSWLATPSGGGIAREEIAEGRTSRGGRKSSGQVTIGDARGEALARANKATASTAGVASSSTALPMQRAGIAGLTPD